VLVFLVGLVVGGQVWEPLVQRLQSVPGVISHAVSGTPSLPTLVIDMNFTSYNTVLDQREEALDTGAFIPSSRDFVTATITLDGSAVPVSMRLRGGMYGGERATQLDSDAKWGFEVRTQDSLRLLGVQRFYLLDPAESNWLSQWAFARTLELEGILAARYQFVRLVLNGDARGIYALQEECTGSLLADRGRIDGVIVGFDANSFWESVAHFGGDPVVAYADPISNFSAADFRLFEVDTFRDDAVSRDPVLAAQQEAAVGLLRALQTGELAASEVFDPEQYGRFLAIVDLWSATEATSLVNLRYYYDPASRRLEPIGCSGNPLDTDARIALADTYDDPALQASYLREATRISQPAYLEQLQAELEPEFERLQQATGAESGALESPWDVLRRRQVQLRRSLDPVKPVIATLGSPTLAISGTIRIDVGNTLNLPVEVVGFDIDGATFLPAKRQWVQGNPIGLLTDHQDGVVLKAVSSDGTPVVRYVQFLISLAEIQLQDHELDYMQDLNVHVVTRLLGLSDTQATLAAPGYPEVVILATDAEQAGGGDKR
jgi:hypothetical protein